MIHQPLFQLQKSTSFFGDVTASLSCVQVLALCEVCACIEIYSGQKAHVKFAVAVGVRLG